jgi:hypothetical protein
VKIVIIITTIIIHYYLHGHDFLMDFHEISNVNKKKGKNASMHGCVYLMKICEKCP